VPDLDTTAYIRVISSHRRHARACARLAGIHARTRVRVRRREVQASSRNSTLGRLRACKTYRLPVLRIPPHTRGIHHSARVNSTRVSAAESFRRLSRTSRLDSLRRVHARLGNYYYEGYKNEPHGAACREKQRGSVRGSLFGAFSPVISRGRGLGLG